MVDPTLPIHGQTDATNYDGSHLAVGNITGSPASTYAGIGLAAAAISQVMAQGSLPTNTGGWIGFGLTMAMSIFAAFSHR